MMTEDTGTAYFHLPGLNDFSYVVPDYLLGIANY